MATHTIQHFYRRRMGRRRKEPLVGDLHNEAGQISSEWTKGLLSSLGPHGSRPNRRQRHKTPAREYLREELFPGLLAALRSADATGATPAQAAPFLARALGGGPPGPAAGGGSSPRAAGRRRDGGRAMLGFIAGLRPVVRRGEC